MGVQIFASMSIQLRSSMVRTVAHDLTRQLVGVKSDVMPSQSRFTQKQHWSFHSLLPRLSRVDFKEAIGSLRGVFLTKASLQQSLKQRRKNYLAQMLRRLFCMLRRFFC